MLGRQRPGGAPRAGTGVAIGSTVALRAVLILDDEAHRQVIEGLLRDRGFGDVVTVPRGLDAISVAGETHADLVVVDLALVGTLGLRLLTILRALWREARIVGLNPMETLDVAALEAGADVVLRLDDTRGLRIDVEGFLAERLGDDQPPTDR